MRKFVIKILLILVCLLIQGNVDASVDKSTTVSGQEGLNLGIEIEAGFSGNYRANIPIPVTVKVFNGSQDFLEGKISISTQSWVPPAEYFHDVKISPMGTDSYDMLVYEGIVTEMTVRIVNRKNEVVLEKSVPVTNRSLDRGNLILVLSDTPDDFSYLDNLVIPGYKRYNTADQYRHTNQRTEYNLSGFHIARDVPSVLSKRTITWESLNSVFCDLGKYVEMERDLKVYLQSWVNLGGEVLFYSSQPLNSELIEEINSDGFLPFRINGSTSVDLSGDQDDGLLNADTAEIISAEYDGNHSIYRFDGNDAPFITSVVSGAGGITLLHFQPSLISNDKLRAWVEIFFQLSLLTPTPYQFAIRSSFNRSVSSMATRATVVPSESEKVIRGVSSIAIRLAIEFVIPLAVILVIGWFFYRSKRNHIFLLVVLPLIFVLLIFGPQAVKKSNVIAGRPLEAINILQLSGENSPALLYGVLIAGKAFPEIGVMKIESPGEFCFYDEMVNTSFGSRPKLFVDNTNPGSLETLEKTREVYRSILMESQLIDSGTVSGELTVMPDGMIQYDITNTTPFRLTNCEFFPLSRGISAGTPRMLPDMAPGEHIQGVLITNRDNQTLDNNNLLDYCASIDSNIMTPETRRELLYYLESMITGTAYKHSKARPMYSDETLFFAWTTDFRKKIEIDGVMDQKNQVSLMTSRLKINRPDEERVILEYNLNDMIPVEPEIEESVDSEINESESAEQL